VATVFEAWTNYVRERVNKGLPDDMKVVMGSEEASWTQSSVLMQNVEWKHDCLKRDEKFDMHFTAAVSSS
jgi:cysteinyl-tRNA synthetase